MSDRGRGRGGRGRGDSQYSESGRGRGNYEERGNNRGRGGFDSNRGRGGAQKSRDVVIPNDRNLKLISNMYKVDSKLDDVYRYEVGFFSLTGLVRSIPSKRLRRLIVVELGKLFDKLTPIAYDGVSILYTLKPLAVGAELKPPKEFYDNKPTVDRPKQEITITTGIPDSKIEVDDERALLAKELDNKVSITYTRGAPTIAYDSNAIHVVVTMPESKVKADKAGSGKIVVQLKQTSITWNDESKAQMLSIATIYSSYKQRSDSVVRGSSVFFTGKAEQFLARNLISDLQLFTGVFQSYRKADIGLVLNVDVSFMVALGNWKISDWFDIRAKGEKFRSVSEAFQDKKFREKINKEIKGMDVRVNYGFKRKYRIDSIDFDRNSQNTTFMVENKKMNLQQYMKEKYNCNINNGTFPLLVARKGKAPASNNNNVSEQAPTYIVPELCSFTEAQKRRAILNSEERAWMIDKTRSNPAERFAVIDDLAKGVTDNDYLKRFPVRFDHSSPIITPGYVLKPQKVEFAKSVTEVPDNKGSWNFKGKIMKLTNPNKLEWAIVYFPEFNKVVDQFLDIFYEQASKLNISLAPNPYKFSTKSINTSDYEATTRTLKNPPPNIKPPKFILFILPDSQSERHHALKRIADIELKIPSKCFVDDGKKTFIPNVVANVLSTINTKVGGYNWTMDSNFKSFIPQSASVLCVMGLDVCHGNTSYVDSSASSGSGNAQSSVALCASYVPSYNKYYTSLRFQDARREVVFEIKQMVIEALKAFRAKNNRLPTDILFYRDGVGEGMYDQVKEWEIKQMKYGMGELYGEAKLPNPRLTFVVVQKRNHLRTQVLQDNESLNPPPGTSITTTVTDKDTNNFYLYSHYALQGTAKPTHYQVLEDGCGFGKNLVEVTYGLSHLHQGCTRSISIPVPVFYADNAAGRANDYYSGFSKIVPNEIQEGFTV